LIISPFLAGLKQKYGKDSLRAIHQSLNIEDRLSALIRKQKLLKYRAGTHLAGTKLILTICTTYTSIGIQREFAFDQRKDNTNQFIRSITHFDEEHYLIVCCTYAQAKAFHQVQCVEMDLAFKMVKGKTNLFSLSSWNPDTNRMYSTCSSYAPYILRATRGLRLLLYIHESRDTSSISSNVYRNVQST